MKRKRKAVMMILMSFLTTREPKCHQFHITIIQLLQSVFFSTKFPHARVWIYKDYFYFLEQQLVTASEHCTSQCLLSCKSSTLEVRLMPIM